MQHCLFNIPNKLFIFALVQLFIAVFGPQIATAEPDNATTYFTPILAVWRDQNAFLVLGTGYGNFYYIYDEQVQAIDGQATYKQHDKDKELLKAIFFNTNGTPVRLHVSRLAKDVLVGIDQIEAPLQLTTETRLMEPKQ